MNNSSPRKLRIGIVELVILILAIVGGVLTIRSQSTLEKYREKRRALEAEVGELPISDPSKIHVQLLKSDDPMKLRWRVYLPKIRDFVTYASGFDADGSSYNSGGGGGSEGGEGIYTVYFNPSTSGNETKIRSSWRVTRASSLTQNNTHNSTLYQQLKARDFSTWQIAGKNGVESFDVDQFKWLLEVRTDYDPTNKIWKAGVSFGLGSQTGYNNLLNGQ